VCSIIPWTCVGLAILFGPQTAPQRKPDLSGRWILSAPAETTRHAGPTLKIEVSDELIISQSDTGITIRHSSGVAAYPKAATHALGSRGVVAGVGERFEKHVFWFGDQLVVAATSAAAPDAEGRQSSVERTEMWSLGPDGRLVVEISERQSGASTTGAILVYRKR